MSLNVLEMAKGALRGDVFDNLVGLLGEDRAKTQSAVDGALPAVLGGLIQGVSTPQGAVEIGQLADETGNGRFSKISGMISGNTDALLTLGTLLLSKVFGARQDGLTSTIARTAGIGGRSAATLLKVVTPLIMNLLGTKKKVLDLNSDQFATMLMDQKEHVSAAMPAEVSLSLDFGAFLNLQSEPSAADVVAAVPRASRPRAVVDNTVQPIPVPVEKLNHDEPGRMKKLMKRLFSA